MEHVMGRVLIVAVLTAGIACHKPEAGVEPMKDYARPLPPGELALRKVTNPADWPDFSKDYYNRADLYEAVQNSLVYLGKPSSEKYFPYGDITHRRAVLSLQRFADLLQQVQSMRELDQTLRREFELYQSVGCDGMGTVYFTGYYCPIFDGRKERSEEFRYPLYAAPDDLVKDAEGRTLGRRMANGTIERYPTRREIEQTGMLKGGEIAWLKDSFEAYVVTVQGSAKLRLADGSLYELGYAGNNGHEYTSVGRMMVERGLIDRNDLSLQAMMRYFAARPQDVQPLCWQNDRYVFFKETPGGPFGSINVPVLSYRSLATDKEVYPRACLAFMVTKLPRVHDGRLDALPYSAFGLDQDTGGAIRAAGRCDVFMGIGQQAEALAGRTGAEGKLYYLFLRPDMMERFASAREPR
jgi:membrane-bound lytic murein transglycosylase A